MGDVELGYDYSQNIEEGQILWAYSAFSHIRKLRQKVVKSSFLDTCYCQIKCQYLKY